ncbi:MAG TPA: hypothetical protein PLG97_09730 [Alcaligenes sp.]|nr:hypothetical protein [Alcaligenes sp.]HRL27786.1 hypothetical protein [Alcaligenes sp.]
MKHQGKVLKRPSRVIPRVPFTLKIDHCVDSPVVPATAGAQADYHHLIKH